MTMETLFLPLTVGVLLLLMALCAWGAFRSYKAAHWGRFVLSVALLLVLGFGWNYFPILVFLLLGPVFGWSFS